MFDITNLNQLFLLTQKTFFVLGSIFYTIFAIVVLKQTSMMTKNVTDKFNPILVTFSWIHLGFSLFLVFLTLTVL
ncbi:hypothetical protein KBC75_01715 [Candidatus Shapirobacteria bacterium]|nr:hypothetical protein [Candidatus Shapirobacteria bacterium]